MNENRMDINTKTSNRYSIPIDLQVLTLMCKYVITDSSYIKRAHIMRLDNLFKLVDMDSLAKDPEKAKKIEYIKRGIEARLDYNLNSTDLIMRHIAGSLMESVDSSNPYNQISASEIIWLNNMISEVLKYGYMYKYVDDMMDVCTRFKTSDFGSKSTIVKEFEKMNQTIQNSFRKANNDEEEEVTFSLRDEEFKNAIYEIHNEYMSPRNLLSTGMQGMNELLGGGFEAGRLYALFALPGEGKSAMLLNLAYQIKKHNKFYKTKDPTKTPCVVLLNMENRVKETVSRLFNIINKGGSLTSYTPDAIMNIMKEKGELTLNDSSPIDLIIKFKPTNSVTTNYLYQLTEDLEDDGYEVICFIQDYIGRIRSTERNADIRLEYGKVTDELKVFANVKNIPVITASQLNRDASKHIDEGRQKNKADLVRTLGRSNISESILILNNIDGGFNLAPEYTNDGKKYMGVQRIKKRYDASNMDYIYLPFISTDTLALEEDYGYAEPKYKATLNEAMGIQFNQTKQSPYHINKIVELGNIIQADNEPNIFTPSVAMHDSSSKQITRVSKYITPMLF